MNGVWMFPGHGSQNPGMGRALLEKTSIGRGWLTRAETLSGLPLGDFARRGPVSTLLRPEVLEPLLAVISIAYVDWLRAEGVEPEAVAGYSAGEIGAMYAAAVFDAETCLKIALIRGELLEKVAMERPGGMVSLSGLPLSQLAKFAETDKDNEVIRVAAFNSPRHVTLAGQWKALSKAVAAANAKGAEFGKVQAAGPWHTPLLDPIRRVLRQKLARLPFNTARIPVWTGVNGASSIDTEILRDALANSVSHPVRWTAVIRGLLEDHNCFLEVGPDHTLWGLLGQYPLPPGVTRQFLERMDSSHLRLPQPVINQQPLRRGIYT